MAARDPYFNSLDQALKSAAIYKPSLIIDLDRLDQNIETLLADLPEGMAYRIVAKSLPIPQLLAHIRKKTGTDRLMTFNLPMLLDLARTMPEASQLLGKPLPAAAFKDFLSNAPPRSMDNIYWLIDTPERLAEYSNIAQNLGQPINIVFELDVGLHRGGFDMGESLRTALVDIKKSNVMRFQGFMGYEPHLASIPTALGWRNRAKRGAWDIYTGANDLAREIFGDTYTDNILRNVAGSPTYRLYKDTSIGNEVSIGSALVKPTDFDTELLEAFVPACFIATPVLKATGATRLPGLEFAEGINRIVSPDSAQTFFTHGGKWMATPVDPPNLKYNKVFGRSSNQEMLNGPADIKLKPDDFIFLRPHQSEAVLLQFGDIIVLRGVKVIDHWPTFSISA